MELLYEYYISIEMTHTNLTPLTSNSKLGEKYLPTTNTDYRANSFQLHFLNNYFNGSYKNIKTITLSNTVVRKDRLI